MYLLSCDDVLNYTEYKCPTGRMVWHTHDTLQTVNIDQVIRGGEGRREVGDGEDRACEELGES